MFTALFWIMVVFAVVDWLASWKNWKRVRWVTKPGTLILLIAWFVQVGGLSGMLVWFGLGLVFSLLGDVLLQLPERFFIPGVGAFFMAHLFYIIGFWQQPVQLTWVAALMILLVGMDYWLLTGRIRAGLRERHEESMTVPVMAYAAILSLMWLSALTTLMRPGWQLSPAILVSVGAGLFFLSDSVLAYNRFVRSFATANLVVMVTYHLGQILIALGVLMNFPV